MEYCGCWFTSQLHEVMLQGSLHHYEWDRRCGRKGAWDEPCQSSQKSSLLLTVLHSFSLICIDNNNQRKLACSNEQSLAQENNLPFRAVGRAVCWIHGRVKVAGSRSGSCHRGLPKKWRCHIRNIAYISTRALPLRAGSRSIQWCYKAHWPHPSGHLLPGQDPQTLGWHGQCRGQSRTFNC